MSKKVEAGDIFLAALVGCATANAIFVLVWLIWGLGTGLKMDGAVLMGLLILLPYAWLVGMVIAVFTALPLAGFIGWLFARRGALDPTHAAFTGAATGILLIMFIFLQTFIEMPAERGWILLLALGFALLGTMSGLAAHRIVINKSSDAV